MSTPLLSSEEKKRQMRRNIILHRRKVLSYLENVYDVDLKPLVKSDPNELLGLDMFIQNKIRVPDTGNIKVKEEYPVKKVKVEKDNFNDCESDVSVGSVERWSGVCQTSNSVSDGENSTSSSRQSINENSKDHTSLCNNKSKEGSGKKNRSKRRARDEKSRRFTPLLRKEHNAKERLCRSLIAKSFVELSQLCSYLDTKRRVPSKFSILNAAKRECDSLKIFEKKLLVEKEYWSAANDQLRRRLEAGAVPNSVITIDD